KTPVPHGATIRVGGLSFRVEYEQAGAVPHGEGTLLRWRRHDMEANDHDSRCTYRPAGPDGRARGHRAT
ncbi:MAG: hypothetical protein ACKOTB_16130, partial [Planctomycetia bacterium]